MKRNEAGRTAQRGARGTRGYDPLALHIPRKAFAEFGRDMRAAWAKLGAALGLWLAVIFLAGPSGTFGLSWADNGNQLQNWKQGADEIVFMLANKFAAIGYVDRQIAQKTYTDAKFGSTIQVSRPPRFKTRRGPAVQTQAVVEPQVSVTVQDIIGVDIEWSEAQLDLLLNAQGKGSAGFEAWKTRVGKPMMEALANAIDLEITKEMSAQAYLTGGTPGTNPGGATPLTNALPDIRRGRTLMVELGVPAENNVLGLSTAANDNVMNGLSGNFVERAINAAELQGNINFPIAGYDRIIESQNLPVHTVGAFVSAAAAVVNGGGQSGSTLNTSGWPANAILKRGDIVSIAGVQSVNWQTRQATGRTATFNVTADCQATAGGVLAIPIYPAIVPPVAGVTQQFQTVDSFPANGAAISVASGTSGQVVTRNLAWHRQAVGLVTIPMSETAAADFCYSTEYNGIRMRMWLGPDITNSRKIFRLDVLPAFPIYAPEGIAIVNGTP